MFRQSSPGEMLTCRNCASLVPAYSEVQTVI